MSALLTARDVTYFFGNTPALRGADLTVDAGEVLAVLGPSGSGKSTLLHCAAGILPPKTGSVHYRGVDLAGLDDRRRSDLRLREFGFVFQFGQLIDELTCLENVSLPLRLLGQGRRSADETARTWLDRLGVPDVAGQRPGQVSGGQAQRIAVARALAHRPAVIFADEPTGALDSLQGEQVMRLLVEAVRETDAALVLITHDTRIAAYSDREIVVRDGRTSETRSAA
ncbi:ABC transporter ATP-binding protein [Nakamurella flava]|uniref:ABC transporter ATP-binding protein n=1 Tax=Nakamurella flava TaxID=2576308 RepID=A0A4V6CVQ7_9ACTN|nr:ABC transporter ATP-binding protein [Nakamurella flava]TKV58445.1 ABC transporter ATP-binding protein [Nakamurella flava]